MNINKTIETFDDYNTSQMITFGLVDVLTYPSLQLGFEVIR